MVVAPGVELISRIFVMGRGYSTYLLGGLLALAAALSLAMGLSAPLQKAWMKNMHLRTKSYPQWVLMQPLPKMYNFDNEFWYQIPPEQADWESTYFRINHYPTRALTFGLQRYYTLSYEGPYQTFLRSTYRDSCLTSAYELSPDKTSSKNRLLMRLHDFPSDLPGCP